MTLTPAQSRGFLIASLHFHRRYSSVLVTSLHFTSLHFTSLHFTSVLQFQFHPQFQCLYLSLCLDPCLSSCSSHCLYLWDLVNLHPDRNSSIRLERNLLTQKWNGICCGKIKIEWNGNCGVEIGTESARIWGWKNWMKIIQWRILL